MCGQSRGDVAEAGGHVALSGLLSRTWKFIGLIKQKVQSSFIVSFLFLFFLGSFFSFEELPKQFQEELITFMSRSQALSLRCAEPGGKSRRVQTQSLTATSGPVLCEAPAPQGLLPPSHHIWEVGCSISTRDWVTSARTVSCSTRDFACGHRRQGWRRGPFRGGGVEAQERAGGRGWKQTAQFICHLASSPAPRNFQGEEPDANNVQGHRGASQIGACTNYLREPLYSSLSAPFGQA